MSLLDPEIQRIRDELGYNVVGAGAEPYISYVEVFNQIIQRYVTGGAATTSSTTVVAATSPTAVTLSLASATGFVTGARVIVDVDSLLETATIRNLTSSLMTVLLQKAHAGIYPVTVDGGETIIREKLQLIVRAREILASAAANSGLKRAEDIEWYQSNKTGGSSQLTDLQTLIAYWRDELASALGVQNLRTLRRSAIGSSGVVLY